MALADGKTERMPGFAAEFVQLKVDAIVAVDAVGISAAQKAGGLIVLRDGFLNQQRRQIAELAAKNRLPTIAGLREFVEAGGLMSYGNSLADQYRRVATYVGKILKGAKPANLPVEQPTR